MPLQIPQQEFDSIIRVLSSYPEGASISELMKIPELNFKKRTLQRRLNKLIDDQRLLPCGAGRSRRYVLPEFSKLEITNDNSPTHPGDSLDHQSLSTTNLFRLHHRSQIRLTVRKTIQGKMCQKTAAKWIAEQAKEKLPKDECAKFIEVIEIELNSLHQGNIARYRLRPAEFEEWEKGWE